MKDLDMQELEIYRAIQEIKRRLKILHKSQKVFALAYEESRTRLHGSTINNNNATVDHSME